MEALVKLLQTRQGDSSDRELSLRLGEVMMCLRIPLTSASEELRTARMKTVRYLLYIVYYFSKCGDV